MFDDLTYEAQMRLLAEAGVESPREMGWDIRPVATVDIEKQDQHLEDNFLDPLPS
jgi:hypothetical protein